MRLWNRIFYDGSETAGGGTPPAAAPWADDLRGALGEDHAAAFEVVDGYLRERWQPRVTQLEEETKDARELWSDLNSEDEAPTAIASLVKSIYGDEFLEQYIGLFGDDEEEGGEEETAPAEETPASALGDEERELLEWARERREAEQAKQRDDDYATTKRGLLEKHTGLSEDDLDLIDPFIYSSPDDLDAAVAAYQSWKTKALGGAAPGGQDEIPTPPAVLGSEGATAATPPAKTKFEKWGDLDAALESHFERQAATRTPPPVVG